MKGIVLLENGPGRDALKRHCRKLKVSVTAFEALVDAELEQVGKLRKRGLWEKFDEILNEIADSQSEREAKCTSAQ